MTGSLARLRATALASLLLGLTYWLGATNRTAGPSYDSVRVVLPIWTWGLILSATALPLLLAIGRHAWTTAVTATIGSAWHTAWCLLFLGNAIRLSNVSWAGSIIFGFLAYLHVSLALATARAIAQEGSECG